MRKSQMLAKELSSNRTASLGERHESVNVLRHLCEEADEKITCGDWDGMRVARLAVRIAGRLVTLRLWRRRPAESEPLTMSFIRLSAALRMTNRLDHAQSALDIAFESVPPYLEGNCYRARARIRIYQSRLPEALRDAREAVELTNGKSHALSLGVLGVVLDYSGEHQAATREFEKCLGALDPKDEWRYNAILVSYAIVLSKGSDEDARRALEICAKQLSRLTKRQRMQRAKTRWLEGLLHGSFGDSQAAWRALDIARRSLIALKAEAEVGAITANMAHVSPQPPAIRQICHEALNVLPLSHPLAKHLWTLKSAAKETIPQAVAALHEASIVLTPQVSMAFVV